MIKTFAATPKGKGTEQFWRTGKSEKVPPANLRNVTKRKLTMLDSATKLEDLRIPPRNRLEKLEHDREGQHSIRINDQFRVCFVWQDGDALDVEITDYH